RQTSAAGGARLFAPQGKAILRQQPGSFWELSTLQSDERSRNEAAATPSQEGRQELGHQRVGLQQRRARNLPQLVRPDLLLLRELHQPSKLAGGRHGVVAERARGAAHVRQGDVPGGPARRAPPIPLQVHRIAALHQPHRPEDPLWGQERQHQDLRPQDSAAQRQV
ncbi:UNVERIFIED_CONTAM: hypothetical protein GTU68_065956, partial [Idotea baltica]|nr:hypothetical protein [Idotea baltica]